MRLVVLPYSMYHRLCSEAHGPNEYMTQSAHKLCTAAGVPLGHAHPAVCPIGNRQLAECPTAYRLSRARDQVEDLQRLELWAYTVTAAKHEQR